MKNTHKNVMKALIFSLALTSMVSCKKKDDETETNSSCSSSFVDQDATGKFMGDEFTVIDGFAKENPFDEEEIRVTLYNVTAPGDKCDGFNFDRPDSSIIFTLPREIGTYKLGTSQTVSFNKSITNDTQVDVATCGKIELIEVTSTIVSGKIVADAENDKSKINGNFSVTYCNE